MVGCSAKYCTSATYKGFRLFRFPSNQERRQLWAQVCQRGNWIPPDSARLCNLHFTEDQFEPYRRDSWRKLKTNAIPTIFGGLTKRSKHQYNVFLEDVLPDHNYASITSPITEVFLKEPEYLETDCFENNKDHEFNQPEILNEIDSTDVDLSRIKCSVFSCSNCLMNTTKQNPNVAYYKFPKDMKLRKQWIKACNRKGTWNFSMSYVCSIHFCDEYFEKELSDDVLNPNSKRKLKKNALPTLHLKASKHDFRQIYIEEREDEYMIEFKVERSVDDEEESKEGNGKQEDFKKLKGEHELLKDRYTALQILYKNQMQLMGKLENEISRVIEQHSSITEN